MDLYSKDDDSDDMTLGHYGNMVSDLPEVTEGLFSRCKKKEEEKKSEKKEVKKNVCGCAPKSSKSSKRKSRSRTRKTKRALNAFIIFYLEMYAKTSGKHVTCVAIEAGKKWCSMSDKEKEKYIQMAKVRKEAKDGKKC